jgi:hypothetical protein
MDPILMNKKIIVKFVKKMGKNLLNAREKEDEFSYFQKSQLKK